MGFRTPNGDQGQAIANYEPLLGKIDAIEDFIILNALLPFRDEIVDRRDRETKIKEKYGLRSLDYLIQGSNGKILDYQQRQTQGEDMDLPLINEQRNLEQLQGRRTALLDEIRLERNLTVGEPSLLGAAVVTPLVEETPQQEPHPKDTGAVREKPKQPYKTGRGSDSGIDAERKSEIEAVGMHVAMDYERDHGWNVEDVSGENHGFDIRSTLYDADGSFIDIRYIEVKARAKSGAIRLSANEWKKARHFEEKFWLYVVTQAGSDHPLLTIIENPALEFRMEEDIFATGFLIPEDKWSINKNK